MRISHIAWCSYISAQGVFGDESHGKNATMERSSRTVFIRLRVCCHRGHMPVHLLDSDRFRERGPNWRRTPESGGSRPAVAGLGLLVPQPIHAINHAARKRPFRAWLFVSQKNGSSLVSRIVPYLAPVPERIVTLAGATRESLIYSSIGKVEPNLAVSIGYFPRFRTVLSVV